MGILTWIVFGLLAGAVAQWVMPGNDPGGRGCRGVVITVLIGIGGAIVGGIIGTALGFGGVSGFNLWSFLLAVGGALIVLWVWRKVS